MILPPYQGQGHGGKLYRFVYQTLLDRKDVAEITVEDPNDDFQDMRDLCDVRLLLESKVFHGLSPPIDLEHLEKVRKQFKLSKVILEPSNHVSGKLVVVLKSSTFCC